MDTNLLIPIISIILGAIVCFFGYNLKKFAFAILWFIVGYKLTLLATPHIAPYFGELDPLFLQLLPLAVGLLCSLIGTAIERTCIAILSFGLVMYLALNLMQNGVIPYNLMYIGIALIIGAAVSTISVRFIKPAIIIFCAIIGAQEIATALPMLIPAIAAPSVSLITTTVITILGAVFQFMHCRE